MSLKYMDAIKRRVRYLKTLEKKIRFKDSPNPTCLIWDDFFDLHSVPKSKAKYDLNKLSSMSIDEYNDVVASYFADVYHRHYMENGYQMANRYPPGSLAQLDLPFNADESDIKKRFRELAKAHHPDTGGDAQKFIELMHVYEDLMSFD